MSLTAIKKRNVAPNWRSPLDTLYNGELASIKKNVNPVNIPSKLLEYVENWCMHRTLPYAGELVSMAYSNGLKFEGEIKNAFDFLTQTCENKKSVSYVISEILNKKLISEPKDCSSSLSVQSVREKIGIEIKKAREAVLKAPYSSIRHIELSRAYLRLGKHKKAKREAEIASQLSPENRYVTRCAVRCFLHLLEPDKARYVLSRNPFLKRDPWLLSADIVVDMIRGKSPRSIKTAKRLLEDKNNSPSSLTELAMALATFENANSANIKLIKKLVNLGLESPNDNSLAQAEWLSKQEKKIIIPETKISDIPFNYEAEALRLESQGQFLEAYNMALKWLQESNFSRRAPLIASSLASINLGKANEGIDLLKIGLIANPNDELILNNLSYHLLLKNEIKEAKKYLSLIPSTSSNPITELCFKATRGLFSFRSGNYPDGISKYQEVISTAHRRGLYDVENIARMNFIREQILASLIEPDKAFEILERIKIYDSENAAIKRFIIHDIKNHLNNVPDKR